MISESLRREVLIARSRGLRQYEIARRARLHPTVLSAILHDAIPLQPDDARLSRLADVLGIHPSDCLRGEELAKRPASRRRAS
jgi:transcriptional regulator with XRE-family HTH domain